MIPKKGESFLFCFIWLWNRLQTHSLPLDLPPNSATTESIEQLLDCFCTFVEDIFRSHFLPSHFQYIVRATTLFGNYLDGIEDPEASEEDIDPETQDGQATNTAQILRVTEKKKKRKKK